jgi:hypothetical protein
MISWAGELSLSFEILLLAEILLAETLLVEFLLAEISATVFRSGADALFVRCSRLEAKAFVQAFDDARRLSLELFKAF